MDYFLKVILPCVTSLWPVSEKLQHISTTYGTILWLWSEIMHKPAFLLKDCLKSLVVMLVYTHVVIYTAGESRHLQCNMNSIRMAFRIVCHCRMILKLIWCETEVCAMDLITNLVDAVRQIRGRPELNIFCYKSFL